MKKFTTKSFNQFVARQYNLSPVSPLCQMMSMRLFLFLCASDFFSFNLGHGRRSSSALLSSEDLFCRFVDSDVLFPLPERVVRAACSKSSSEVLALPCPFAC